MTLANNLESPCALLTADTTLRDQVGDVVSRVMDLNTAPERIREGAYALILVDCRRDNDAMRVVQHLAAANENVVALVADDASTIDAALQAGAWDCWRWPMPLALLRQRAHQWQQRAPAHRSQPIYDEAPIMLHSVDEQGYLREVNRRWLENTGYRRDEVIGQPLTRFIRPLALPPSDATTADHHPREEASYLWETDVLHEHPCHLTLRDGSSTEVLLDAQRVPEAKLSLGTLHDISVQRQIEESLRKSQRYMQSIINAMTEAILIVDENMRIVNLPNAQSPVLVGRAADMLGYRLDELWSPQKAATFIHYIQRAFATGDVQKLEFDIKLNGERRWFSAIVSPLQEERQVVCVVRDTTKRRWSEEALRQSEQRYRHLFEYASDMVFLSDAETGRVLDANLQAARALGYSHDELLALHIGDIEKPTKKSTREVFAAELRPDNSIIFEQLYRRRDGVGVPVETSSRIIEENGRQLVLSFARDISARKEAQRGEYEQRQLAEALRDTAAAISRSLDLEEVVTQILEQLARVVPHEHASVMLLEANLCKVIGQSGLERWDVRNVTWDIKKFPNFNWMREHRQPRLIANTLEAKAWQPTPGSDWVASYLGAPIVMDSQVIGFINLDSATPNHFTQEHAERLQAFANQAAIAIQNAHLFDQLQAYAMELEERVTARTRELSNANDQLKQEILERQRAENALEEERNLLRTLIDALPDGIFVKDMAGRYMVVNSRFISMTIFETAHDLIGYSDRDLHLPAEWVDHYEAADQRVFAGEIIVDDEDTLIDAEGMERYLLVTKVPLRGAKNQIVGLVCVVRDVTDIRRAEAQLLQVLRSARCLLWYAIVEENEGDYRWNLHVANEDAAQRFLPLNLEERDYSRAWQESIYPEDQERREFVFRTHLKFNKLDYAQEFRCRQVNNATRWLAEDVQIRQLTDHRWSLVGVVTDITDRKLAEDALKNANDTLERRVARRTAELMQANEELKQEINERKRAEEAEREQRMLAEALQTMAATLNSKLELGEIFNTMLDFVQHALPPHEAAAIMVYDETTHEGIIVSSRGLEDSLAHPTGYRLKIGDTPKFRFMVETRQPHVVSDTQDEGDNWVDVPETRWIRSHVGAPIATDTEFIGWLSVDSAYPGTFNEIHGQRLLAFTNQAAIAIQNARLLEKIREYAASLEDLVRERTAELESERAQLRAILDSMRDGVIFRDGDDIPQYTNRALQNIMGYTFEEWLYQPPYGHINVETDAIAELRRRIERTIQYQGFWRGDVKLRRKDGSIFDASLTRAEVRDAEEQRIGQLSVIRDISAEKHLEEQKARFIASASHELRTPITNLKTHLYLMRHKPTHLEHYLDVAESVANWMQNLVENLFDLSRFERGVMALMREERDIQALVRDAINYQRPEAAHQHIDLHVEMPDTPIRVNLDPHKITQVLTNLLSNALNYTPEGGHIDVRVWLDSAEPPKQVHISVQDTGIGIPAEYLPQVFQPFFRGRNDNKGAGLGLSISKEIVELHGGELSVESTYGEGSCFTISLNIDAET